MALFCRLLELSEGDHLQSDEKENAAMSAKI